MNVSYDDIIELPHHTSKKHTHMSIYDRSAQFSSFAALNGHSDAIKETARLTERKIELDDDEIYEINQRLSIIKNNISIQPKISVTYFRPDENKEGGAYILESGDVRRIDEYEKTIIMTNGNHIHINDIKNIDGEIFDIIEKESSAMTI